MTAPVTRALVAGAGRAGRRHLRHLRLRLPHARLACWRATQTPADADLLTLADEVMCDEQAACRFAPDLVVVASPASHHVRMALPFAAAGVPLLVEKPIAADLDAATELVDACRSRGSILAIAYSLRFHPLVDRLAAEVHAGRIGRVIGVHAEVGQYLPDWRPGTDWRQSVSARRELGGGVLLELSHEFDYLREVVGEISAVAAMAGPSVLELDVEDHVAVLLRYESGAVGTLHLDMLQRPMRRGCRVIGTDGVLELDLVAQTLSHGDAEGLRIMDALSGFDRSHMFLAELDHFLACVAGTAVPRVDGEGGRRVLELALAARDAAASLRVVHV